MGVPGTEELVAANGVELCVQSFGDPGAPAILLIGGGAASMDWWEDGFCRLLADGGRFVVRYDSRDTGRSVSYPPGAPGYTLADLVADAVGLLDAFGLARAHLVGMSVGGGVALRVALWHPDRVASVTVISTSVGPDGPPMAGRLEAYFAGAGEPDWADRAAVIEHLVDAERHFAGSRPLDERRLRELAGRVFDRTPNMATVTNHGMIDFGDPIRPRLAEITAPTLVLHGTEDPMYPYGHAQALAAEIPGATLVPLEKVGHQMPPPDVWDVVVPAILRHTATG